jgi:tetratricopeptide (TPR) repeat protein
MASARGALAKPVVVALRKNLQRALFDHRLTEAEEVLSRLKREDPLAVETRGFELELHIESERLAEADALANQLCRMFPGSARIWLLAGKLSYRQRRYEQAEQRIRESERIYPHPWTQYWLGKTLTQAGRYDEAESLLLGVRQQNPWATLILAWLYDRKNDFEAALKAYDEFLEVQPGNRFATDQRLRIKARMLEPEALIDEVDALSEMGEPVSEQLFPEFVQSLFDTGQTLRAREEIAARLGTLQDREAVQVGWISYRKRAYDIACTVFLSHLPTHKFDFKYLSALESAAAKCNRLREVLDAYLPLAPESRQLYGRLRSLQRRLK